MAVQSVMCGSCGAGVPYGRLSCPSCGDLLASVAGGRRPTFAVTSVTSADTDDLGGLVDDLEAEADSAFDPPTARATVVPTSLPAAPPPPGSYIPPRPTPVAPMAPAMAAAPALSTGMPAGPAAPARAWAGRSADGADVTATDGPASSGEASRPFDTARVTEAAGWLAIGGAALAGLGFLMPWSVVVIGSPGTDYFDRWGLAGPGHLVIALALVAIVAINALDQVTSRIPLWLRAGIPGLGFGALLLGLVWPYVIGPLGADPGAVVVTVGALVLVVAGIVGIAADRHAEAI